MMTLSYRLVEKEDVRSVFDLYMEPTANPFLTFDPMPFEKFIPVFDDMFNEKNLFVVTSESNIVATYRLIRKTHRQSHVLYLGGFTVNGERKGRGLGYEILEHIKDEARVNSIKRIELTVDTKNRRAISLYRKVGFEIEGNLRNNYRLASDEKLYDEYVMALLLD